LIAQQAQITADGDGCRLRRFALSHLIAYSCASSHLCRQLTLTLHCSAATDKTGEHMQLSTLLTSDASI